ATLTGAVAIALSRQTAASATSRPSTPIRGLMARVFSLASAASCESAPTDSSVLATGPPDRVLGRRGNGRSACAIFVADDRVFCRAARASIERGFDGVRARAFVLDGTGRSDVVARAPSTAVCAAGPRSSPLKALFAVTTEAFGETFAVEDDVLPLAFRGARLGAGVSRCIFGLLARQFINMTWARATNAGLSSPS